MEYSAISKNGDREINEDCLKVYSVGGKDVFIIADGVGQQGFGAIASRASAETVMSFFDENHDKSLKETFKFLFEAAHVRLKKLQREAGNSYSFKTTLAVLVADKEELIWGHVGDSRIYRFKSSGEYERTLDHSMAQIFVQMGEIKPEDIRENSSRNKLIRVLGDDDEIMKPDIRSDVRVEGKDSFVICTDGFWEYINGTEMSMCLRQSGNAEEWLKRMMDIVDKKGRGKQRDNTSAIAVIM